MAKKFNLKSGNCPSFKEMGSGDSPFNQSWKAFMKRGGGGKELSRSMLRGVGSVLGGGLIGGGGFGANPYDNIKNTMEQLKEKFEEFKTKEYKLKRKATSEFKDDDETIPGAHSRTGSSKSTKKMSETSEDLPENTKDDHSH